MDGTTLSTLAGVGGVGLTAIVAPWIDRKVKAHAKRDSDQRADKRDELEAIRVEQRELRAALSSELQEARIREAEKDGRIDLLEEKVRSLQMQVDMFRAGLTHPPGFILLPRNVWISLRERLGDQLPPGPFVGEDIPLEELP